MRGRPVLIVAVLLVLGGCATHGPQFLSADEYARRVAEFERLVVARQAGNAARTASAASPPAPGAAVVVSPSILLIDPPELPVPAHVFSPPARVDAWPAAPAPIPARRPALWQTDPVFGARRNAYGPGVHMDATGRSYEDARPGGGFVMEPVRPNAYGLGVGMDATGSPVEPAY